MGGLCDPAGSASCCFVEQAVLWARIAIAKTARHFIGNTSGPGQALSTMTVPAQPVDATQALNLSAGVSNCKVCRGRSLS